MNGAATALTSDSLSPAKSAAGLSVSFDEAFTLHHRAVFSTAYALLRDAGLAEDVTQEVFLKLYRHREDVPSDELLRAWLLRVAINTAHNTMRSRSRSSAREDEFAKQMIGTAGASESLEMDFERRARIEEARRALAKIDEPMRSCLILKQQGMSYKEIAAALEVNESYVGSLVARGRKEFTRLYGKIGGRR